MPNVDAAEMITAKTFVAIMQSNHEFAREAAEVLYKNTTIAFKCDHFKSGYEFGGFGKLWFFDTSLNKGIQYLRHAKSIHVTLPQLKVMGTTDPVTHRTKIVPHLDDSKVSKNFQADIEQIIRIFNSLPEIKQLTITVPMAKRYANCLNGTQNGYLRKHFKAYLKPFEAFNNCDIEIQVNSRKIPGFNLKNRCSKAWEYVDSIERGMIEDDED
jgi:hypothetical protein